MPLPAPILHPPFNTVRLSHTVFDVTDLKASRAFWSGTLGLQVTAEAEGRLFLRAMEERGHHCIVLREAKLPAANALSFKVWEEGDLDRAKDALEMLGRRTSWVERPYQGRTLASSDPHGVPVEFYARMDRLPSIHQNYAAYHGVKPLRIDHFNCFSPNVDESVAFWNTLGFRVTEYTADEDTGALWAAWMHRKGGVHDIAFTNGLGPRLHHTAFWVSTPLNIIDLLDLMATTGYVANIERGPGRHGISNAFFPLRSRSGRPPDRTLLLGLSDRGSGPRTDSLGPEGPAAPNALGRAGAEKLVRKRLGVRGNRPARARPEGGADRRSVIWRRDMATV